MLDLFETNSALNVLLHQNKWKKIVSVRSCSFNIINYSRILIILPCEILIFLVSGIMWKMIERSAYVISSILSSFWFMNRRIWKNFNTWIYIRNYIFDSLMLNCVFFVHFYFGPYQRFFKVNSHLRHRIGVCTWFNDAMKIFCQQDFICCNFLQYLNTNNVTIEIITMHMCRSFW